MAARKRRLIVFAVIVIAVAVGCAAAFFPRAAGAPPVAAKKPKPVETTCAKRLLRDWGDGRIDSTYPVSCYRDALKTLPTDLSIYSSAPDDIRQALSQRIVQSRNKVRRPTG